MITIYLVRGQCGEYSDHEEHIVCAYADKSFAEKHAANAQEWVKKTMRNKFWEPPSKNLPDGCEDYEKLCEAPDSEKINPFDPQCVLGGCYANDTKYDVLETELKPNLPEGTFSRRQ